MEEFIVEALLNVFLLFGEVHLLELDFCLLLLECGLLFGGGKVVVDDDSVDVVLEDDSGGRTFVWKGVSGVETL
jgi:hypothetical protein